MFSPAPPIPNFSNHQYPYPYPYFPYTYNPHFPPHPQQIPNPAIIPSTTAVVDNTIVLQASLPQQTILHPQDQLDYRKNTATTIHAAVNQIRTRYKLLADGSNYCKWARWLDSHLSVDEPGHHYSLDPLTTSTYLFPKTSPPDATADVTRDDIGRLNALTKKKPIPVQAINSFSQRHSYNNSSPHIFPPYCPIIVSPNFTPFTNSYPYANVPFPLEVFPPSNMMPPHSQFTSQQPNPSRTQSPSKM
ncbi:hypothetical protein VP01_4284g1, partial [Puccinia sorghi]